VFCLPWRDRAEVGGGRFRPLRNASAVHPRFRVQSFPRPIRLLVPGSSPAVSPCGSRPQSLQPRFRPRHSFPRVATVLSCAWFDPCVFSCPASAIPSIVTRVPGTKAAISGAAPSCAVSRPFSTLYRRRHDHPPGLPHPATVPPQGFHPLAGFPVVCPAAIFQAAALMGLQPSELFPSDGRSLLSKPHLSCRFSLTGRGSRGLLPPENRSPVAVEYFIRRPGTGSPGLRLLKLSLLTGATGCFHPPALLRLSG
jgi:hypothetical protein